MNKFKVGDVVNWTVVRDCWQGITVVEVIDDYVRAKCPKMGVGAFFQSKIEHAHPVIVAEIDSHGKPRPNENPVVHKSIAAATVEAERLSKRHPGTGFAVFKMVSVSKTATSTVVV
jgi:hypothetical protein